MSSIHYAQWLYWQFRNLSRSPYYPLAFIHKRFYHWNSDFHSCSNIPPEIMRRIWFDQGLLQLHKFITIDWNVFIFITQPPKFKTLPNVLYFVNIFVVSLPCLRNPTLLILTPGYLPTVSLHFVPGYLPTVSLHSVYGAHSHFMIHPHSHCARSCAFNHSISIWNPHEGKFVKNRKVKWENC